MMSDAWCRWQVPMWTGINRTIEYFRNEISRRKHSERNVWLPDEFLTQTQQRGREVL